MATVKLCLLPSWDQCSSNFHMVAVFQAYHTADLPQRVVITGPGIQTAPLSAVSNKDTPKGTTFLCREIILGVNWQPFAPVVYTVELGYIDGDCVRDPVRIETVQSTPIGSSCVTAWAFTNDSGLDKDMNDTVLSISLFPYSLDV